MKIGIVYPSSPFNIRMPQILKVLTKWYEKALKIKIEERKKQFGIESLKTSPSWGYRILPSILYVSSLLKENGIKVELIHEDYLNKRRKNVKKFFSKKSFDGYIFVLSAKQHQRALTINSWIKENNSDSITVYSGQNSVLVNQILSEGFDIVVKGEIEATINKIVSFLKTNEHEELKEIPGVYTKRGRKTIGNGIAKVTNLDELPDPDFSILPKDFREKANISWRISRGCPFRCEYCYEPYFWNPLRFKSIDKIQRELELYKKYFNFFNHIFFHDSTFNVNKWKDVLKIVEDEFDLYFSINLRLDILKGEDFRFLKKYRPVAVFSGVETAEDSILRKLGRNQKTKDIVKKALKINSIVPFLTLSFIVGLPGETLHSIEKTKKLILQLLKIHKVFQVTARIFTPYPVTPIYKHPQSYGIEILTRNFERYDRYSFPPVIRHKTLSEFEIYSQFLRIFFEIVKANLEITGFDLKDIEEEIWKEINERDSNPYKPKYG